MTRIKTVPEVLKQLPKLTVEKAKKDLVTSQRVMEALRGIINQDALRFTPVTGTDNYVATRRFKDILKYYDGLEMAIFVDNPSSGGPCTFKIGHLDADPILLSDGTDPEFEDDAVYKLTYMTDHWQVTGGLGSGDPDIGFRRTFLLMGA